MPADGAPWGPLGAVSSRPDAARGGTEPDTRTRLPTRCRFAWVSCWVSLGRETPVGSSEGNRRLRLDVLERPGVAPRRA